MNWMFVPYALAHLARALVAATLLGSIACPGAVAQGVAGKTQGSESAAAPAGQPRQLTIANKPWTGDFDKMLERRMIRVYAPFSRSLYFSDKGRERGIAVELVRDWERYLNIKYAKQLGKRPLTIYIAPATRDKLLPYLGEGLADVVDRQPDRHRRTPEATSTSCRATKAAGPSAKSSSPDRSRRSSRRSTTSRARRCTCARRRATTRACRRSTSASSATASRQVELVLVPDALEDEDMMEMLNAG